LAKLLPKHPGGNEGEVENAMAVTWKMKICAKLFQ
jgi:hypothetical protein